jgi:magnesium-transporting ATPase (P-type)
MIINKIPFSSERKRGSIVVKTEDGNVRIYCKGAPDLVLRDTTGVVQNDSVVGIDD